MDRLHDLIRSEWKTTEKRWVSSYVRNEKNKVEKQKCLLLIQRKDNQIRAKLLDRKRTVYNIPYRQARSWY
jgi:hypothetical protein